MSYIEFNHITKEYKTGEVSIKALDDAVIELGELKKINPQLANKEHVQRAIDRGDIDAQREISNFFFKVSGIYSRLCRHFANFYRYDWLATPYTKGNAKATSTEKIVESTNNILYYLDIYIP